MLVRPIRRRDGKAWYQARSGNRDWLEEWDATRPPEDHSITGPVGFRTMAARLLAQARAGQSLPFVVVYKGTLVGQVNVSNIVWGSARWGQIGYWIDRRYAGRGVIPTAVALVVDHCFSVVRLHRIEVAIRPENSASLRVVQKLGIRQVGFAPGYLHINGEWRDHLLFAVTAEEAADGLLNRLCQP